MWFEPPRVKPRWARSAAPSVAVCPSSRLETLGKLRPAPSTAAQPRERYCAACAALRARARRYLTREHSFPWGATLVARLASAAPMVWPRPVQSVLFPTVSERLAIPQPIESDQRLGVPSFSR